ncbi:MAG TPA: hypothetical protein VG317_11610 [Pseudonocardiaceae bacterium]|nr:hypothetical protein [Pseudonocardiaceae bacterium]
MNIRPNDLVDSEPRVSLRTLGWPLYQVGSSTFLSTTSGFCGVEVNRTCGERMLIVLRAAEAAGPVIGISQPRRSYIFLAEADIVLGAEAITSLGATLLKAPAVIPLPPSETPAGRASWVVPPTSANRWLPSLSTVRWALATAVRPAVPEPAEHRESA